MSYKKYYEGGWQSGETGGTPITPESLNHMEQGISDAAPMEYAKKVGAPYNIVDNGYWKIKKEIVNQIGKTEYAYGDAELKMLDRWFGVPGMSIKDGYVTVFNNDASSYHNLYQRYEVGTLDPNKTYTMAVKLHNGTLCVGSGKTGNESFVRIYNGNGMHLYIACNREGMDRISIAVQANTSLDIEWVRLFEGEYTAETLTECQPQEHATELLKCQRHYWQTTRWTGFVGYKGDRTARVFIPLPTIMRVVPTFSCSVPLRVAANGTSYTDITVGSVEMRGTMIGLIINDASAIPKNHVITLLPTEDNGVISLSAEI